MNCWSEAVLASSSFIFVINFGKIRAEIFRIVGGKIRFNFGKKIVDDPIRLVSEMDEWPSSPTTEFVVSSPRRTLSFLRERRSRVSLSDSSEQSSSSSEPITQQHGPKPSEVYGFVGSITTVIATVIYLVWAYTPEPWLHSLGITYYPSKYWALAIPAFAMVTVVLGMIFYLGLNFMVTPPPTSYYTMFDEYSRERAVFVPSVEGEEHPIEPISDIGINEIDDQMFGRPI